MTIWANLCILLRSHFYALPLSTSFNASSTLCFCMLVMTWKRENLTWKFCDQSLFRCLWRRIKRKPPNFLASSLKRLSICQMKGGIVVGWRGNTSRFRCFQMEITFCELLQLSQQCAAKVPHMQFSSNFLFLLYCFGNDTQTENCFITNFERFIYKRTVSLFQRIDIMKFVTLLPSMLFFALKLTGS